MDIVKRNQLVEQLAKQPTPPVVPIEKFFDGNDDPGSIGCNLAPHPGIEIFRNTLLNLARRGDVEAIYAQIAEIDPGAGCWPFTDTLFVAGAIELEVLTDILKPLQPDDVGHGRHFGIPASITQKHPSQILAAWWD